MAHDDLCRLPASRLRGLIAAREISPVELVQAVLDGIDRLQPQLNCFITVCADEAIDAARQAEAAVMRGDALAPLHGIPYTAKDLVNTAGVRTTYGSMVHAHNVPAEDAAAIAGLRRAGAILVGKTTTPEFGHKGMTDAPLFGRTPNAWNMQRTAAGSSGGAAVAVAAGLAPRAVATDGGGSTRIPAAANGVVGIKQSIGLVPHSQAPDAFGNYTYVTPMTRTVMDTALMLDAMSGYDARDPWSANLPPADYAAAAQPQGSLAGTRILAAPFLGHPARRIGRDAKRLFELALERLADLGAEVVPCDGDVGAIEPVWRVINHATWRARFSDMLAAHRDVMSESLVRQIDAAAEFSAEDYQRAMFARTVMFRTVQHWFERADFIITPALTRTALPIDQDFFTDIDIDGERAGELRSNWYPYTMLFNLTGHPAVSLPCGFGTDGLPLAIQLIAPLRADAQLLRLAALYESSQSWPDVWPDIVNS